MKRGATIAILTMALGCSGSEPNVGVGAPSITSPGDGGLFAAPTQDAGADVACPSGFDTGVAMCNACIQASCCIDVSCDADAGDHCSEIAQCFRGCVASGEASPPECVHGCAGAFAQVAPALHELAVCMVTDCASECP